MRSWTSCTSEHSCVFVKIRGRCAVCSLPLKGPMLGCYLIKVVSLSSGAPLQRHLKPCSEAVH